MYTALNSTILSIGIFHKETKASLEQWHVSTEWVTRDIETGVQGNSVDSILSKHEKNKEEVLEGSKDVCNNVHSSITWEKKYKQCTWRLINDTLNTLWHYVPTEC